MPEIHPPPTSQEPIGLTPSSKLSGGGSQVELGSALKIFPAGATIPTKKEHFLQLLWTNKHITGTLCAVFLSFGMCVAFLGPTLLDLGCKTNTVFATMSWVFFSQSLFVLLGSACGGILVQRISHYILLVVSIIMMCVTMAIIPFCGALWILAIVLAIMGFFMGTIDTVANVTMIRIYGKDVSPFLQALHFFYGVGAFISPMIAQPFLLNEDCDPFLGSNSSKPSLDKNETLPAKTLEEAQKMTHINYAFWIMSALMVPVAALSLSLLGKDVYLRIFGKAGDINQNKQEEYENPDMGPTVPTEEQFDSRPVSKVGTYSITLLCASLMFLYDGLQAIYGGYLYSYAVIGPVSLDKSYAAYLNALFWGMFAFGRLLSIPLAAHLKPAVMLACNIAGCSVGMLLMAIFYTSKGVLVFGTCVIGLFMSSVFPTALSITENYIKVTPGITTFLVFGAALGEMIMPVIVGHEFDRYGPISFVLIGLALCILSITIFRTLILVGQLVIRRSSPGTFTEFVKSCFTTKTFAAEAEGESTGLTGTQHVRYYSRMDHDDSENNINETAFTEPKPLQ